MKKCDVLLICHDANRGDTKDGLPYSKIIDALNELIDSYGFRCTQFARPYSKLVGKKAWGKPYSLDKYFKKIPYWNSDIYVFLNWLLRRLTLGSIGTLKRFDLLKSIHVYTWLLLRTRPRLIIAIQPESDLCRLAYLLKIPLIEPLHGLGYSNIPWDYDTLTNAELPSFIVSFDQLSTSTFSPLKKQGIPVLSMEHPWYNSELKSQLRKNDQEAASVPHIDKQYKKVILVSLVWGYGDDFGAHPEFSGILVDNHLIPQQVVDLISETHDSVFWCIRRHPVQLRSDDYDYQLDFLNDLVEKNKNCEWEKSSTCSLDSFLPHIDGHITMSSMTSYDAALFGIKTLTLCPTILPGAIHEGRFQDLVQLGYLEKAEFDKEIIQKWISETQKTNSKTLIDKVTCSWHYLVEHLVKRRQAV